MSAASPPHRSNTVEPGILSELLKKFIKKIFSQPFIAKIVLRPLCELHSFLYDIITSIAPAALGKHPKHAILNYPQWFSSHITEQDTVLDIGSNTGKMVHYLCQKASFVYGIEINPVLVEQAKYLRQTSNSQFICADATTFDYSVITKVNVITMSNVLEHVEDRDHFLSSILSHISRNSEFSLKVLIRVPLITRDWLSVYKKNAGLSWKLDDTHFTEYTERDFFEELKRAGLTIIETQTLFGEIYAVCFYEK